MGNMKKREKVIFNPAKVDVLLPDSPEVKVNGSTVVEIKEGEDDALVPWLDPYARIRKDVSAAGVIEHCNANYKRALLLTNTGN